jgi:hypothetical protein
MRESRLFGSEGGAKLPSSLPLFFTAPLRGAKASGCGGLVMPEAGVLNVSDDRADLTGL